MTTQTKIDMKDRELALDGTYEELLEVGFGRGALEDSPKFIDKDVMGYGTALDEKIMSYDDFEGLIKAQRKQANKFNEFIYQSNPVLKRLFNKGNSALIVDEIDLTTVIDGEKNKMTVRMSTVLEYQNDSWVIVHWHGSLAEHISGGEDPWHVEEWKQKAEELERMVEEKTADLLIKNRELEIETSLERVRTVAMGMARSEDLLDICEVSYNEFEKLGFTSLRAVLIHIHDDESRSFTDYDYCKLFGGQIANLNYDSHPLVVKFLKQTKSSKDAFAEAVFSGEELESWKKIRLETGQKDDPRLNNIEALYYYGYSIGVGDFTISTLTPIDESQRKILKRFRNVFDLAYRRYLDITQAEAQVREAEIQLALERVRARTMAMHRSDELAETASILFKQMTELGVTPERITIGLIKEETKVIEVWSTDQEGIKINYQFNVSLDEQTSGKRIYEAWKEKKKSIVIDLSGKELNDWILYVREEMGMTIKSELIREHRIHSVAFFSQGIILTTTPEPLPEESMKLLERFADVFNLTYRRFQDLQKAEAQAREAQIEAALERVRSRAMAMHSSEDLAETVDTFFSELNGLNITPRRCGVGMVDEYTRIADIHATTDTQEKKIKNMTGKLKLAGHPVLDEIFESWKLQKEYHPVLRGSEISEYYQIMNPQVTFPDFATDEVQYGYYFMFKEGGVFAWTDKAYTDTELQIFRRYTSVLSLTYRRFLDLKEAEAQAREAKIEAALEKVRSRSLAMHTTNELGDVVKVIVEKLLDLGVVLDANGIVLCTYFKNSKDILHWIVSPDFSFTGSYLLPYFDHPIFNSTWESKLSGDEYFSKAYTVEEKNSFFEYAFEHSDYKHFPDEFKQWVFQNDKHILSFAWQKNSAILIPSHTGVVPSEDDVAILKRFAKVFEQSYVRFLDLKKAEAQAREAEIQLALERIRARTMAMQQSDELSETSFLLAKQVRELGINAWGCAFHIYADNEDGDYEWFSNERGYLPFYKTPREKFFKRYYEKRKNDESFYVEEFKGKKCLDHYLYIMTLPVVGEALKDLQKSGKSLPDSQIDHVAYFKYGYLLFITYDPVPEAYEIFKRFAKEFEQTYTRFLDLQKAEAQNKIIQAENARKTQELEEARQLQLAMLPKELPNLSKLDIAVYMQTATEVGGDYYDFSTKDDGSLNVCLGDATGHGLKAGTLVSMIKSLFVSDSVRLSIKDFFNTSNETLKKMSLNKMMMAFAMINIYGNKIKIANAGIPPIYIYRKNINEVEEIKINGLPIGAMRNSKYEVYDSQLNSGDVIIMLSDGMPELQNTNDEMYGYERLREVFSKNANKTADDIITVLKQESNTWSHGREPDDDITFVVIKIK